MAETIPQLFIDQAARFQSKPLFWVRRQGRYEPIAWEQAAADRSALAAFLLNSSVNAGDRILILSENRPEWGVADLAIQSVGAWSVPLYPSLTSPEILMIARDCQPVAAFVSTADQARKLRAIGGGLPALRLVVVMDAEELQPPTELSWSQALEQGRSLTTQLQGSAAHRLEALRSDSTATIIYTSGTTGEPKGVLLSHRNFLSNAAACLKAIPIGPSDLHLSFLPLSHVFERMAGWYLMLMGGAGVAYAENMDRIPANMLEVRPTVMLGVPRFFEKLHARIREALAQAPPARQRIARWAVAVGERASGLRTRHAALPLSLRAQLFLAEHLVFQKFRARLGGRLRFFVSGSAPLSKSIAEFFSSLGILILEGYGLTETSPVIAVNRLEALKFGSVGQPLEGVEVRIAPDGEILTRGPHIMQGYYGKAEETRQACAEGWFHTGDIGHLDEEGFLSITDRKKDLIKTAGGKFVAPQKLENLFITDPYVSQAFVYGDRERYCVALIVPNAQRLSEYAAQQGWPHASYAELVRLPAAHQLLWSRIQQLQQPLASYEQVKAVALLDQEFSQAAGELTPTLKTKRAAVAQRYRELLTGLYQSSG
ncbi:MAG: long-chain fatty acid--CoA ligase [Candidatus Omnitrophica bacterium]|nr:long-chain fatty acid--CoA ligase [Candidatus Omnitrophota bacterium]